MKFKHIFGTIIVLAVVIVVGLFGWSYSNNEGDGSDMYQPSDNVTVNTTKREESQSEPVSVGSYNEQLPKSENSELEYAVDLDELNYAINQEVSEAQEYQELGYSEYNWVKYVYDLYVTDDKVIVLTATQELDYLEEYDKVEVIKEVQKVVGVKQFVLSDDDVYGNMPIAVYNLNDELIAKSNSEAPRDIKLY